jgi:hypothetical protein
MPETYVVLHLDHSAIAVMLHGQTGEVGRDIRRRGNLVLAAAKANAPVRSGKLRGSLKMTMGSEAGEVVAYVGTPLEYGIYVHEGTGIYGPRGMPIRPTRARVLAWNEGGRMHFARSVRGMKGRPFLADALRAAV